MARRNVSNNNWSRLGELVLKVWQDGQDVLTDDNAHAVLESYGVQLNDDDTIKVHHDEDHTLNVVIPARPAGLNAAQLKALWDIEAYKRELGIIVMGGCR